MADSRTVSRLAPISNVADVFPGVPTFGRTVVGRGGMRVRSVSVKDIGPNGLVAAGVDETPVEHLADVERYVLQPGDVLLSVRGTRLKVAVVPEELAGAVATATLAVIRIRDDALLPDVLVAYLRSSAGQAQLSSRARSATGQIALTARDIREVEVPLPPTDTQRRIAALARELDAYETAAAEAIQRRRDAMAEVTAALMETE
jgi:hypothetical protein